MSIRTLITKVIEIYQKTISPDHGWFKFRYPYGYCKFYPSCSEYSRQVISRYGVLRGSCKSLWRILRCNPWSKGGVEEV
jgi:putative membrane protein insertion efficiency factor